MKEKKNEAGALLVGVKKTKLQKTRDEDCCSVNFLKCVLHIFNVIYMFAGCAVLAVGVWTVMTRHRYTALLSTPTYVAITYLLVVAGAIAIPLCAIGCCGLRKENRTTLLFYTYFLLISFILELGAGSLAYYYEVAVETELKADLNSTFLQNYNIEPPITKAIDSLQIEFRCCGAVRFEDWRHSTWLMTSHEERRLVPDSCCKTPSVICGKRDHPSNIHYTGCIRQFTNHIREHLIILAAVGVGMSVVPIFGFMFSCCLYVKIKHVID